MGRSKARSELRLVRAGSRGAVEPPAHRRDVRDARRETALACQLERALGAQRAVEMEMQLGLGQRPKRASNSAVRSGARGSTAAPGGSASAGAVVDGIGGRLASGMVVERER